MLEKLVLKDLIIWSVFTTILMVHLYINQDLVSSNGIKDYKCEDTIVN